MENTKEEEDIDIENQEKFFGKESELENFDINGISKPKENEPLLQVEKKKRRCCRKFPTSYVILLSFEVIMFILTFIVQKGKFQTLAYSNGNFTIKYPNTTTTTITATEEELNRLNIKIPLKNFKDGLITKPVPIPNTYEKIDEDNISFFFFIYKSN